MSFFSNIINYMTGTTTGTLKDTLIKIDDTVQTNDYHEIPITSTFTNLLNKHTNGLSSHIPFESDNIVFSGSLLFDIINDKYSPDHKDIDLFLIGSPEDKLSVINTIIKNIKDAGMVPMIYVYMSIVQIIISDNSRCIQLICTNFKEAKEVTDSFDMTYLMAYYHCGKLYASNKCISAYKTCVTNINASSRNNALRIYKALKNGMKCCDYNLNYFVNTECVIIYNATLNKHKVLGKAILLDNSNYETILNEKLNKDGDFDSYCITVFSNNANNAPELTFSQPKTYGKNTCMYKIDISGDKNESIMFESNIFTLQSNPICNFNQFCTDDRSRNILNIIFDKNNNDLNGLYNLLQKYDAIINDTLITSTFELPPDSKSKTKILTKINYQYPLIRTINNDLKVIKPKIQLDENLNIKDLDVYMNTSVIPRDDIKTLTDLQNILQPETKIKIIMHLKGLWLQTQTKNNCTGVLLELIGLRVYEN